MERARRSKSISPPQARTYGEASGFEGPLGTIICKDIRSMKGRAWWDHASGRGKSESIAGAAHRGTHAVMRNFERLGLDLWDVTPCPWVLSGRREDSVNKWGRLLPIGQIPGHHWEWFCTREGARMEGTERIFKPVDGRDSECSCSLPSLCTSQLFPECRLLFPHHFPYVHGVDIECWLEHSKGLAHSAF